MQQWPAPLRRHLLVFGAEPAALAEEHLQRLVADQSREGDDLEFKRDLYGRADKDKIAVSTDIAALANDRGGVIVLGVDEEGEIANSLCPVALDGDGQRWIREVAARHTAPHVPFDLLAVPSDADPTHGWLLLVVPPSPRRPHAVVSGNSLRIPRRHGTTTRYLSEAELSDMYRNRFVESRQDVDRSSQVMEEGLHALAPPRNGVLALALLPSAPGRMIVDGPTIARIKEWLEGGGDSQIGRARYWVGFFGTPPDVFTGHRRIVASSAWSPPHQPPYCELHTDGAGFAAAALFDARLAVVGGEDAAASLFTSSDITIEIARLLRLLGSHARDHTGAYGDALLQVRVAASKPFTVGYTRFGFPEPYRREILVEGLESDFTIPVDSLAGPHSELLATTWMVASDLLQTFGVPEARVFTNDGAIRQAWAPPEWQTGLADFAREHRVKLDDTDPAEAM